MLWAQAVIPATAETGQKTIEKTDFQRAVSAYHQGNLDTAREILAQLIKKHPNDPKILNNLAVIAMENKEYDHAIALLKQAIATNNHINTSYHNLSRIYAYKASLSYKKALTLNDDETHAPQLDLIDKRPMEPTTPISVAKNILTQKKIDKPLVHDYDVAAIQKPNNQEIVATVQNWAKAWSEQDLTEYFNNYLKNYHPDTMSSHRNWKELRTARITDPNYIKIRLSDMKVSVFDNIAAYVTFRQNYESNTFENTVRKQLDMLKIKQQWKIIDEKTLP